MLLALSVSILMLSTPADDLVTIRARLIENLRPVDTPGVRALTDEAARRAASIDAGGKWPDVDYLAQDPANWPPQAHLVRLRAMARAWAEPSAVTYQDPNLAAAIGRGLDAWLRIDPKSTNWWHNEIGAPMAMRDILLLTQPLLSPEQLAGGIRILDRADGAEMTGQNLVWTVGVQVGKACIIGDPALAQRSFSRIFGETRIAAIGQEGIQADLTFHQHGPTLYSGGYGRVFAQDTAQFVALAHGTSFAASPEQQELLERYLVEGVAWSLVPGGIDYATVGREIVRPGRRDEGLLDAVDALEPLGSPRQTQLRAMQMALLRDQGGQLRGHRHFWRSDYSVHRGDGWVASVRMHSTRTRNTDGLINGENKSQHLTGDGMTLLYPGYDPYGGLFPLLDWKRVPGTTADLGMSLEPREVVRTGNADFVGGVSDGKVGLAAMDLRRGRLSAKKAWFFFDRGYVCLGAGIACPGGLVTTTVDQGDFLGGWSGDGRRAWRSDVGVVATDGELVSSDKELAGNWSTIGASSASAEGHIATLSLEHGSTYAYAVVPRVSREAFASGQADLTARVVQNDEGAQIVVDPQSGIVQAVIWRAGRYDAAGWVVEVDSPCLILLRANMVPEVWIAEPTQKLASIRLKVETEGRTWTTSVALPQGVAAGGSVRAAIAD